MCCNDEHTFRGQYCRWTDMKLRSEQKFTDSDYIASFLGLCIGEEAHF